MLKQYFESMDIEAGAAASWRRGTVPPGGPAEGFKYQERQEN